MEPKLSQLVELRHVRADSYIGSNFSSLFVRPGDRLNLTCSIAAPKQTDFVYWYKNKEPVQFDTPKVIPSAASTWEGEKERNLQLLAGSSHSNDDEGARAAEDIGPSRGSGGGEGSKGAARTRDEPKVIRSTATFLIKSAQLNDTANYTCLVSTLSGPSTGRPAGRFLWLSLRPHSSCLRASPSA